MTEERQKFYVDKVLRQFAKNVYRFRNQKRFTQQDLAVKTGIKRSTLSNLENAKGAPTLSNIVRIAEALNIGVDDLLLRRKWFTETIELDQISEDGIARLKIFPEKPKGFILERMVFAPSTEKHFEAEGDSSVEAVCVVRGSVQVKVTGYSEIMGAHSRIDYRADQNRIIRNPWPEEAEIIRAVVPFTYGAWL